MERRNFAREFKLEAVELVKERGVGVQPLSRVCQVFSRGARPGRPCLERYPCLSERWVAVSTRLKLECPNR
jgi:hypothetical protein